MLPRWSTPFSQLRPLPSAYRITMPRPPAPQPRQKQRKIGSRSCDACKIRKVKCTEVPPCERCQAIGIACTFNKTPSTRGPRSLRAKTLQQIQEVQQKQPTDSSAPTKIPEATPSNNRPEITVESLVLRLCIYRLRLFPVWPILAVEEVIAALQRDAHDVETFALAVAVGAATMAQLKLGQRFDDDNTGGFDDKASAACLEAECQRIRRTQSLDSGPANLNKLRTSFFLHIYHENQEPGGPKSLLYLREAITLAQILGLHRASSYLTLKDAGEDRLRRRILWLLFVTERGVAMLHKLPIVLTSAEKLPPLDGSGSGDEAHNILPAFRKLVDLFRTFDQSRAFEILQDATDNIQVTARSFNHETFNDLRTRLQHAPFLEMENGSNDIQKADICVTRQWMQVLIWRAALSNWAADSTPHHRDSSSSVSLVAAPLQIAQEFLDFISLLPSAALEAHGPAIEFKVYEIASAVADSVTGRLNTTTSSLSMPVNVQPSDILIRLQRILATSRGGNSSLLGRLTTRIAQLKVPPSYMTTGLIPGPTEQPTIVEVIEEDDEVAEYAWSSSLNLNSGQLGDSPQSRPLQSSYSPWLSLVAAAEVEQQSISTPLPYGTDPSGTSAAPVTGLGNIRPVSNWYTQPMGLLGQLYNMDSGSSRACQLFSADETPSPGDTTLGDTMMLTNQNWLLGLGSPSPPG
ncbi:hypothetical protein B0H66DRAFT_565746 [Apodospora peruviana]|uniref:Zn(2)-C6 fungal-type domain-containing protein n=1 Tax=Apodospora peruviana TaxID=516989 RepID=A0AAE0HUS1_9PEZI|nr:hypothetical protein B0H66DRAFT_565746 [Apodospora peruviana]